MAYPIHSFGDNYSRRITLRLSESQFDFVVDAANSLDITPSDFIRLLISKSLRNNQKEVVCHENIKANSNCEL